MLFNPAIERMPLPQLRALQTARLKEPVACVYDRVPCYRQKLAALGVHPAPSRGLGEPTKLGFIRKTNFQDNYPSGPLVVPEKAVVRLHCSSGPMGKATVVGYLVDNPKILAEPIAAAQQRQPTQLRARFAPAMPLYELTKPVV